MRVHVIDAARRLGGPLDERFYRVTRGYWFPLVLAAERFRDLGVEITFHTEFSDRALDCDVALVSSRHHDTVFATQRDPAARAASVSRLAERGGAIAWVDMRDSSGTAQFEVLPFVSVYLKQCLLKDRALYARPMYGGRIFTDRLHNRTGLADTLDPVLAHNQEDNFTPLDPNLSHKLRVGWNIGYGHRRLFSDAGQEQDWLSQAEAGRLRPLDPTWADVDDVRPISVAALMSTDGYCRDTIIHQRRLALERVAARGDPRAVLGVLPPHEYASALSKARIVLSCFGNGEICYREHEAWQAGAAVVMPDMSHLETFPTTYREGETYWPVDWELETLDAALEVLLHDTERRRALAWEGQLQRRNHFSEEGLDVFTRHFMAALSLPIQDRASGDGYSR
jgi:hypothetical protein